MQQEWRLYTKKADFKAISDELGISQTLARCMRNRDLLTKEDMDRYLHAGLSDLYDPLLMKGMSEAVELIGQMRGSDEYDTAKVAVATDYDCDGIFSGYILKQGLTTLGFDVKLYTPDRITEGYGLNRRIIDEAVEDERELLITCDNGIAAVDEVEYAVGVGMTVIVTDHHEPQETLPPADVILDPKQPDDNYPFDGLCGAGVAYKLICSLYDAYAPTADKEALLEYVAIATVADVMELKDENRILVKTGLKKLENTPNLGLKELLRLQQLSGKTLNAGHIGFIIGPCFNSAGRISSVQESFDVLYASTTEEAVNTATKLKSINDERKTMTQDGVDSILASLPDEADIPDILLLQADNIHESLVGIIAGKVKESINHPVIVFAEADSDDDEPLLKGSGRSIPPYNMFENLLECKDLMVRFGGHAMAAGLTIRKKDLPVLSDRLNNSSTLTTKDFRPELYIDIALPISRISESLISELKMMEPFGVGNPGPIFAEKDLQIKGINYMGDNRQHLKLRLADSSGYMLYGIAFGRAEEFRQYVTRTFGEDELSMAEQWKQNSIRMAFAYVPEINIYNGSKSIQLSIKAWH